jgi:hypothetical protein
MPTTQEREQGTADEQQERENLHLLIRGQILRTLGTPPDLRQVQVRHLWNDQYRANVLIGTDAASAKVAHSYFLQADSTGKILVSTPTIVKQY